MRTVFSRLFALALLACFLTACQTKPPVLYKGLTPAQIEVVKAQGFEETDDAWKYDLSGKVLFNTSSSEVNEETRSKLTELSGVLLGIGIKTIVVEGHTDDQGSAQFNEALSKERATVVANALSENGFAPGDIRVRGLGFQHPIADNNTPEGRRENRRVSLIIGTVFSGE